MAESKSTRSQNPKVGVQAKLSTIERGHQRDGGP